MGKDFKKGLGVMFSAQDKKETPPAENLRETLSDNLNDKIEKFRQRQRHKGTHTKIPEGLVNTTLTVNKEKLEKFRALAYWERKLIKDYIDEALDYILSTKTPEEIDKAIEEYNKNYKPKN